MQSRLRADQIQFNTIGCVMIPNEKANWFQATRAKPKLAIQTIAEQYWQMEQHRLDLEAKAAVNAKVGPNFLPSELTKQDNLRFVKF